MHKGKEMHIFNLTRKKKKIEMHLVFTFSYMALAYRII